MRLRFYITMLLVLLCWGRSAAQDKVVPAESKRIESGSVSKAADKVSKSLEDSAPDGELASNYMELALQLTAAGDHARAETHLQNAVRLYEKLRDKEMTSLAYRGLAKAQEAQDKTQDAIASYENAAKAAPKRDIRQLNRNDAERLKNYEDIEKRTVYIQSNIDLAMESDEIMMKDEAVNSMQQMARVQRETNDREGEIASLDAAMKVANTEKRAVNPTQAMKAKQELAEAYIADDRLDMAAEIQKEMVQDAKVSADPKAEIAQLQSLSNTLAAADMPAEAIESLEEAYDLSVKGAQTLAAGNSVKMLAQQYIKERNTRKALETYEDFMERLESLIMEDSTLVDDKYYQLQEQRIAQLENERGLKDELIARKNTFNYVLLGSVALILIFLLLIIKALYSIKKKNKRIALQSLRREMNPHFIFNSLNSVNQFIASNNELEANKYLSSYSKLMRNIMENSNRDFISLTTEMEQMKEYLELEHMRFKDKFSYKINIDPELDGDALYIPNMLIQPQLENAVWHGLRYKEGAGTLLLDIRKRGDKVCVTIEDDGIGIRKSGELKTEHQKQHRSRGLTNTRERIALLNSLYGIDITMEITDREPAGTGATVILCFPLLDKNRI